MIVTHYSSLDGHGLFTVSATDLASGDVAEETGRAVDLALRAIADAGFSPDAIVRSRLFTRDRASRQAASDARRALLAGPRRGASSSFIDPGRLPAESRVRIDLTVMTAGGGKQVVEYDPPIAPPRYVRIGGLVFLSGVTDVTPGLDAQIVAVRKGIGASLEAAGASVAAARLMSIFLARGEDPRRTLAQVAERFAEAQCPITLTPVDGYSAPEKRIEIELTARLG